MRTLSILATFVALAAAGCSDDSPSSPSTPTPTPTPVGPVVLRSATFAPASGFAAGGGATIVRNAAAHSLELDAAFSTAAPPPLSVRLCANPTCTGDFVHVADLRALSGAQDYALSTDGTGYGYVIIWCIPAAIPVAEGPLR